MNTQTTDNPDGAATAGPPIQSAGNTGTGSRSGDLAVLRSFLGFPLHETEGIFRRFASLPGAEQYGEGKRRVLHVPGRRGPEGRVLLVAHADTVWDNAYKPGRAKPAMLVERDGVISSASAEYGIGADDRAGCALLWLLRDSGHGLLLTDGEEFGCLGSHWLRESRKDVFARLNAEYSFMVQFDRRGRGEFKTYQVGTDAFRAHVAAATGFRHVTDPGNTDISILCDEICGVNLATGYGSEHGRSEYLVIEDWLYTLDTARAWLSAGWHPGFPR